MSTTGGRFLTGSTMGHVLRMTLSGTAGITFLFVVDAANLFWISWLGETRLVAAVGFAFALQYFSISFGIGLMIATTALVSRAIGKDQRQEARRLAASCLVISVLLQTLVALSMVIFRHELVALTGAQGETAELTARYLLLTLPSLPIMAVGMIGGATLRAEGDAFRAMLTTMGPGAVAVILDPFFIILLKMQLDGAALAFWFSRLSMASISLFFVIKTHNLLAKPKVRHVKETLRPFSKIAGPTILTQLATPFGSYLLTTVIAGFGDSAVAAWAVINRLTVLAFGGIFSLSGAVGGIFGQNFGAGKVDRILTTYRDAIIFCVGYPILIWAILMGLNGTIIRIFRVDAEGAGIIWAFTHVGAGAFVFTGMMFVANAAFNNLGRPVYSTLINWTREGVISLPLALWFASLYGASGVVYAQAVVAVLIGVPVTFWGLRYIQRTAKISSALGNARAANF